jgi:hypothetical protein
MFVSHFNLRVKDLFLTKLLNMNVNLMVSVGSLLASITIAMIGGAVSYTNSVAEIKETIVSQYVPRKEIVDMIRYEFNLSNEDIKKMGYDLELLKSKTQEIEIARVKDSSSVGVKLDSLLKKVDDLELKR